MKKWVLVTGSSRGIGAAIIKKFASFGYNVLINYKTSKEEALNLQKEIIDNYHVNAEIIQFDVASEEEVKKAFEKIEHIDCLVNNAGISIDNAYINKDEKEFKQVISTNLIGPFLVTKYAVSKMDNGAIINIASNAGIDDYYPFSMDYDASKAGLINLTHNYASVLAPKIRVNAVAPGWVLTDMTKYMDPLFMQEVKEKCMLGRLGRIEEIANVVYFLASEDASFINDTVIRIDGGLK